MSQYFLPVLLGTSRPKRESIKPAQYVLQQLQINPEIRTQLVDPKDFNFPFDGNDEEVKDPNYTKITAEADGFIIVTPEYNHGYPGSLKRMLDSESNYSHYIHKPVAFVGVSDGPWGGVRVIEALVTTVRDLGLVACSVDLHFAKVPTLFDEQGNLKASEQEAYGRRFIKMMDEFLWMVRVLKAGREK